MRTTLDLLRAVDAIAACDPATVDRQWFNAQVIERLSVPGEGLFVAALRRAFDRRGLAVPMIEHDLLAERPVVYDRDATSAAPSTSAAPTAAPGPSRSP